MSATEKIAVFTAKTRYKNIPETALQQAKTGIMDWILVSLAGEKLAGESMSNFKTMLLKKSGRGNSTLIGSADKVAEDQAALFNGCIGHFLDYDETCPKVRSHLFASVFPALLASAESKGASGKQLLTGFIVGHEVAMRVGETITPAWIKAGWHGTSLFGVFGAAAGCANLMNLDVEKIRTAIGLTSSMASGVSVNFGYLAKPLHAGMAAERGLLACQLAQNGFTANQKALESTLGFYHAYNWGQPVDDAAFDMLGNPWGLEIPGISAIKLYPCCHGLATNIECGIRIHDRGHLKLGDIATIEIHSQPKTLCAMLSRKYEDTGEEVEWGYQGPPRQMKTVLPTTGAQAKFSKEYAFSRAVKDGRVGLADLTDQAVNEPEIRKWMGKIKIYHNSKMEQYSNQYPEETAPHAERMIVNLKNGETIKEEEIFIRGMTKRPLYFDDVLFKYDDCGAAAGISKKKIDAIISIVNNIEQVEDVSTLMKEIKR